MDKNKKEKSSSKSTTPKIEKENDQNSGLGYSVNLTSTAPQQPTDPKQQPGLTKQPSPEELKAALQEKIAKST